MISIKKVQGGALQESLSVEGVAFKKTFAYAGFEQMTKSFTDPKIVLLNVELELKAPPPLLSSACSTRASVLACASAMGGVWH